MKKQVFGVETNDSQIYRQLLTFLNFSIEATKQEREVLAELVRLNHDYEGLPPDKRAKFILSTDMRKEVRELLDIEEKQFNTILSRLKKKTFMGTPIFDENNAILPTLLIKPDDEGILIGVALKFGKEKQVEEIQEPEKVEEPVIEEQEQEEEIIEEPKKKVEKPVDKNSIEYRMRNPTILTVDEPIRTGFLGNEEE
jgi:hypothetical protein